MRLKRRRLRIPRSSTKNHAIEDLAINLQGTLILIHLMMILLIPSPSPNLRPPKHPTKYQRKREARREELSTKRSMPTLMLRTQMMRRI